MRPRIKKGVIISIYGRNVTAWFTNKGIQLQYTDHAKTPTEVFLTPKKAYSKYEQESFSKLIIDEFCTIVKYYGDRGVNSSLNRIINKVRPGTVADKEDIQSNRYYKVI